MSVKPLFLDGATDGFLQMLLHVIRQAVNLPDDFEAHIAFVSAPSSRSCWIIKHFCTEN